MDNHMTDPPCCSIDHPHFNEPMNYPDGSTHWMQATTPNEDTPFSTRAYDEAGAATINELLGNTDGPHLTQRIDKTINTIDAALTPQNYQ